jgi:spermidine synthase
MKVSIDISEEAGVRYLHFGSDWVQGAMRIARPWALELDYTRDMMFPLLLKRGNWPKRVLLIGMGSASLLKFLYRFRPEAHLTVVEIAPDVVNVARQYFKLPRDDERIEILIGDGVEYMKQGGDLFDLILVDGFDPDARAGQLDTVHFYSTCRARLANTGLLVVNLLRRSRGHRIGVMRLIEAFQGRVLALPETEDGNTVVIAAAGAGVKAGASALRERARDLRETTKLNLEPLVEKLLLQSMNNPVAF